MFMAIGLIFFGAISIWAGRHILADRKLHEPWPTVSGRLLERDTVRSRQMAGGPTYEPAIKYTYVVEGKEYTGTQMFSTAGQAYDATTMRKKVDALPATPEVHYNPSNPTQAFLVLTSKAWGVGTQVFGWLLAVLGALVMLGSVLGKKP